MVLDSIEISSEEQPQTPQHFASFTCPVEKCARSYKSVQGLQHHLKHVKAQDHHGQGTPATLQPTTTPKNKKSKHRNKLVKVKLAQTPTIQAPEPLTFEEAQKMVQLDVNGIVVRIGINESLDVIASNSSALVPEDDWDPLPAAPQTCSISSTPSKPAAAPPDPPPPNTPIIQQQQQQLPEASFRRLPDYSISDAPPRPNAYIRFIEKSAEELDGEVEYDVDEEDSAWLCIVNKRREAAGLAPVAVDSLELLMDRFEKESYFQATQVEDSGALGSSNAHHHNAPISMDDDAVCCICMDGECQNTNVILFCDMCNLAVHQDCYGVPYIPEGQWLCRRCLQSPSRAVSCVLCPNQGGAFKQTDRGDWAHVVCALWIPEVRFANTVFLEPVDSVEAVPAARWRLTCVICRQRGVGACIQCHRASCYAAFHVTCAQHYGLYMRMQTVPQSDANVKVQIGVLATSGAHGATANPQLQQQQHQQQQQQQQPVLVQKIAYCEQHSPPNHQIVKKELPPINRKQNRTNAKRAKNHQVGGESSAPVILLPTIPPERIQEIGALVQIQKKSQFIQRLIAYWMLKRQFRNGVPLLRRLQSSSASGGSCGGGHRGTAGSSGVGGISVDTHELYQQLKYWQCLRQDLERARLLCELVRKREKLKAEFIRSTERCLNVQLHPLQSSLLNIISLLSTKDTNDIFGEPVDPEEVPDYSSVVTDPMDLSTIKSKCEQGQYEHVDMLEKDFDLMIANCLKYNNKDTMFYRAGVRMRELGRAVLKFGKEELEKAGLLKGAIKQEGQLKVEEKKTSSPKKCKPEHTIEEKSVVPLIEDPLEIDKRLVVLQEQIHEGKNLEEILKDLEILLAQSQALKHGLARAKRVKIIRNEIIKIKRLQKEGKDEDKQDEVVKVKNDTVKDKVEKEVKKSNVPLKSLPVKASPKESSTDKSSSAIDTLESSSSSSSQVGVNRRTAVLFTRKALNQSGGSGQSATKKGKGKLSSSVTKSDGVIEDVKVQKDGEEDGKKSKEQTPARGTKRGANRSDSTRSNTSSSAETHTKRLRRSTNANNESQSSSTVAESALRSHHATSSKENTMTETEMITSATATVTVTGVDPPKDAIPDKRPSDATTTAVAIPDSFRVYRDATSTNKKGDTKGGRVKGAEGKMAGKAERVLSTDDEDDDENDDLVVSDDDDDSEDDGCSSDGSSSSVSTCYSHTLSELEDISNAAATTTTRSSSDGNTGAKHADKASALQPLQLVWAKCRGYPWYPALIIDPGSPAGGVLHRGVPLPGPPADVLALRASVAANNNGKQLYLILFFDAKRTWQWLPADKLEIMDLDADEAKTNEPRKPADRKAVKRAFQHAIIYMKQVTEGGASAAANHDAEDSKLSTAVASSTTVLDVTTGSQTSTSPNTTSSAT